MQARVRRRPISEQELNNIPWLSRLTDAERSCVLEKLYVLDVQPGDFILHRGDTARNWFGVVDGLLKAAVETEGGDTITYTGLGPGGWFGEGTLLKQELFGYNVQALRKSSVACLPYDTFKLLLEHSFPFCWFIMDMFNERLAQFMNTVETDRTLVPEQRVALTIKRLINPVLSPMVGNELQITQQELSYLAGLSRQRVNRALQHLQKLGIIAISYGTIKIVQPEALRNIKTIDRG